MSRSSDPAETLDAVQNELAMAGHAMLAWDSSELHVWTAFCARCLGKATVWIEWTGDYNFGRGPEVVGVHSFRPPILLSPCASITAPDADRSPTN